MSDIVRMLRVSESDPVQQEAADEIERLRAELAAYVAQAERGNQTMVAEACELRKEITRLRELLVEARHEWLGSCQIGSARAALRLDVFMSRIDAALNEGGGK